MRKYLPTLGELIDRLSIIQLKEVKIPQHKEEYAKEISDIVHDINEILKEKLSSKVAKEHQAQLSLIDGDFIRAVIVLSQMNTHIWYNEDKARSGENKGNDLLLTHGLNGIRNTAKNKIQEWDGGRKDYKVDCIAAEFKEWEVSWKK
jgi:hypothetical protein